MLASTRPRSPESFRKGGDRVDLILDPLTIARRLTEAGMTRELADATADAIREAASTATTARRRRSPPHCLPWTLDCTGSCSFTRVPLPSPASLSLCSGFSVHTFGRCGWRVRSSQQVDKPSAGA